MPRIDRKQIYKGRFIPDQTMFWLDLQEQQRAVWMETDVFRLAGAGTEEAQHVLAGLRLKENPWKPVERYDVLHKGQRPDGSSWQYLCITVEAGTGKTMASEQTEYLLAEHDPQTLNIFLEFTQIRHGVNFIMGTSKASAMSDVDTPLLIRELQKITVSGQQISGAEAWELLQRKIGQGKLTLVIDAIDQFAGKVEVARESAVALREFLQRYPEIRCVVSGRPYAVKRFREELFAPLNWDFVQLGQFDEAQRIRRVGQPRWDWAKRLGKISMGVPRWLDVLLGIPIEKLGENVRTLSDLYLLSLEDLIQAARHQQPDALKDERAWYLFSLLAFEMMTDPQGPFRGQGAGVGSGQIGEFKLRIWDARAVRTKHGTYRLPELVADFRDFDAFDAMLGQLGCLNEMLDDPVIAGTPEDPAEMKQIFWRDQTLMDMFAALWMTRWATDEDRGRLRTTIPVRWRNGSGDYQDMWRLAAEVPDGRNGRVNPVYAATMCLLLEPAVDNTGAVRSTELIWRVWHRLQDISQQPSEAGRIAQAGINGFLQEYCGLLKGSSGAAAQSICEEFESWFVFIDGTACAWHSGDKDVDKDVDGEPLPIVDHRYRIAKYPVTNELYRLFDSSLDGRYAEDSYGIKKGELIAYGVRGRAPVVAIDWYDAWCVSTWLGGCLPTEQEWEYACRAGSRARYSVGDGTTLRHEDARFGEKWSALAVDVDAYSVGNAWDLYQMHGNVWEWCANWYDAEESFRCLRGGSFNGIPERCRSANRVRCTPSVSYHLTGVRVSRAAGD